MMRPVFDSIVVGTDGSQTANEAVRQAADLAKRLGAKVHLVSAYEPVPEGRDEYGCADGHTDGVPRIWIFMQVVLLICLLASLVIAVIKL